GEDAAILGPAANLEHPARPPGLDFLLLRAAHRSDPCPGALPYLHLPPAVRADQPSDRVPFPGEQGPRTDESTARGQAGALEGGARRGGCSLRGDGHAGFRDSPRLTHHGLAKLEASQSWGEPSQPIGFFWVSSVEGRQPSRDCWKQPFQRLPPR